jgi:DNA-binding NarL/FixJ family response regulator
MPGMGGKEFLRQVKENPNFADIPVVIVSTSDAAGDVRDSYKLKAAGYIQKCPSQEELKKVVQKLVHYWFATSTLVKERDLVAEASQPE